MKRFISLVVMFAVITSLFASITVEAEEVNANIFDNEIYVSLSGSDDIGDGSIERPFATIEKARDTIRAMSSKPEGGITVNIRGGIYPASKTIHFTAEDSGTKDSPIIYQAYNGEEVTFSGGKNIDATKIKKVTDAVLLDKLVEEEGKNNLYMLDLEAQGITIDEVRPWGWSNAWTADKAPMRIYMNNTVLDNARYPNRDQSQMLMECRPLTAKDGINEDEINTTSTPVMMEFPAPDKKDEYSGIDERIAKWEVVDGESYIGGSIVHFWASDQLLLESAGYDANYKTNILKTKTKSSMALVKGVTSDPEHKIFFANIFAEIDKPGESFVDRSGKYGKKGVVYFYPVGSISDAEFVVSTLRKNMISVSNASNLVFDGINFKYTIETPISISDSNNIIFRNADISNTSQGGVNINNCKGVEVSGCNIYTTGTCPINVSGTDADRKEFIYSGVVIENNMFHNTSLLPTTRASRAAINLTKTVGVVVRYNEFNDLDFGAMDLSNSNDTLFEYNVIKNAVQNSADAGAIYWGHQISTLGNIIRYNYFENIGSNLISNLLNGGAAYSIFVDGASPAGNYYGNIFLNGSVGGGVIHANGGEFGNVSENISIETQPDRLNYAYEHKAWGYVDGLTNLHGIDKTALNNKAPIGSYIYINNFRKEFGNSNSGSEFNELLWTDQWRAHYRFTLWERALEQYNETRYNAVKKLHEEGKYADVLLFLSEDLPNEHTTHICDNVAIGETRMGSLADYYNNYTGTQDQITDEDKALFVDFDNKDFTLTPEGLTKIQSVAKGFNGSEFKKMGLFSNVGGHKPIVTIKPEIFSGTFALGNTITAEYEFFDEDGDNEGDTKIYWYISDKADGDYKLIRGVEGDKLTITENYINKYIKYEIVPYDNNVLRGESVMSDWFIGEPICVESICLVDDSISMSVGETETIAYEVIPENATNQKVVWKSSNEAVATVENGVVTAKSAGKTVITATTDDGGFYDECYVNIYRASGTYGDNLKWTLDDKGVLFISGVGPMCNYQDYDVPWHYNKSFIKTVVFEKSVENIGNYAFYGCSSLTSITIPDNINSIGASAFSGCSSLVDITISDSITLIDESAFSGCSSLKSITIPDSINSIGASVFSGCSSLVDITIPDSVTLIDDSAFSGCSSLKSITIPDSINSIGASAFSGCSSLVDITIPDSITLIDDSVFSGCSSLTSITIPESVTNIVGYSFYGCAGLENITLPDSLVKIGEDTFGECTGLETISIPDSVTSIGKSAFYGCSSLEEITLPFVGVERGKSGTKDSVFGIIFGYSDSGSVDQKYTESDTLKYHIPSSLRKVTITDETVIPYGAFSNCNQLTDIVIEGNPEVVSADAFYGCSSLTSITIPDSVTSIGKSAFCGCSSLEEITLPFVGVERGKSGTKDSVFGMIFGSGSINQKYTESDTVKYSIPSSLKKVTITDETVIPYGAFSNCNHLTEIVIEGNPKVISADAFYGCSSLTSITIPDSVTSIGKSAFCGCSSLEEITLPFVGVERGKSGTEDSVFGMIFGSGSISQKYTESNTSKYAIPSSLKKVTITDESEIPYGAFSNCIHLTDIIIEGNPKVIYPEAFYGCTGLLNVTVKSKDVKYPTSNIFNKAELVTLRGYKNSSTETYANRFSDKFYFEDLGAYNVNPILSGTADRINNKIVVSVELDKAAYTKCLHIALYNSTNTLLDYIIVPNNKISDNMNVVFKDNKDASYAKVFLWNSLVSLQPIAEAVKLEIK